jgi:hypothetical protein
MQHCGCEGKRKQSNFKKAMDATKGPHCSATPSLILIGQYALFAFVRITFIKARLKFNLTLSAILTISIAVISGLKKY